MEGKLVAEIIDRLARRDGLDESAIKNLQNAVRILEEVCDGLGFCLSENGDLLSQWRGYAYDATGFSIGFSKEYFQAFSEYLTTQKQSTFSIQKVKYDFEVQEEVVKPTYDEVRKIYDSGRMTPPYPPTLLGFKNDSDYEKEVKEFKNANFTVYLNMLKLLPELYALKTAAFQEEMEWRLITYLFREGNDPCAYRAVNDRIIPYKSLVLPKLDIDPVIDVKTGPKNLTPVDVVEGFLKANGYKDVTISRSGATYR
jgi:hypothetical protein